MARSPGSRSRRGRSRDSSINARRWRRPFGTRATSSCPRTSRVTRPEVLTAPGSREITEVILSLDEGTTGATAIAVGLDGEGGGKGYAEITQHYPRPGWVEHD